MLIEFLLWWLLQCMALQDLDEFWACLDEVVLEYNMSLEWNGN
jgi:hypothetical protein